MSESAAQKRERLAKLIEEEKDVLDKLAENDSAASTLAQARDILRGDGSDRSDRDTLAALWRLLLPEECGSDGTEEHEQPHEVEGTVPSQWWLDLKLENQGLRNALEAVVTAYTAWAEDHNDGTYAYYKSDDLMVACVAAREALHDGR